MTPDETGSGTYSGFAPDSSDLGVAFYVTGTQTSTDASGNTTTLTAQTSFTDGSNDSISISVSCTPTSINVGGLTTCIANLTDTALTPNSGWPQGTVGFTAQSTLTGNFSPTSCTLAGSGEMSSCSSTFTATAAGSGTVKAHYNASSNNWHNGNDAASTAVAVTGVAPAIASSNSVTFTVLTPGTTFTVTSTGTPMPSLSESGALPSGVTFVDNGNGTATISGTPASGTVNSYPITITASNGVSPSATQNFTIAMQKINVILTAGSFGPAIYDGNTHALSACTSSVVAFVTCTNNPAGPVGPDVGGAPVAPTPGYAQGNASDYNITSNNGSWQITPLTVNLTAGSLNTTYNGSQQSPSACTSDQAVFVTCANNPASVGPDVGSGAVNVASPPTFVKGNATDYTINTTPGTWKITALAVTLTGGNYGPAVYDGNTHALSACTSSAVAFVTCTNNPTGPVGPDVGGPAPVAPVPNYVQGNSGDYNITSNNGSWQIMPLAVTLTAGSVNSVYNGSTQSPSACSSSNSSFVTCANSPSSVGPDVVMGTTITPSPNYVKGGAADYSLTSNTGTATITALTVTVTAGGYAGVYDGNTHPMSACTSTWTGVTCTNNPAGPVGPDVGGTSVVPVASIMSGIAADYNIVSKNGSWSITPLAVMLTAGSYSGTYDGNTHALLCTSSAPAFVTCTNNPSSVGPHVGSGAVNVVLPPTFVKGNSSDYNLTTVSGTLSITAYPDVGTASVTPGEQVYTGNVVFNATLPVASVGGEPAAMNVSFYICPSGAMMPSASCQNMTPTPVALQLSGGGLTATTAPIPLLETVVNALQPGNHTVVAVFGGVGPDFTVNIPSAALKIDQQAAKPVGGNAFYTGATVFWTTSPTTSTATLFLSATLQDPCEINGTYPSACGNVTLAKVTFLSNGSPINGATNLPVGLVNATNPGVGTAAASVQYNLGNATSASLNIQVQVSGYYTGVDTATLVTVSLPLQAGEMKFLGTILCDSASAAFDPSASNALPGPGGKGTCFAPTYPQAGVLLGAAPNMLQFAGDITLSKTNPQGHVQGIVVSYYRPDGSLDVTTHTYLIQSNSISTFNSVSPGVDQFTAKASIQDLTTGASVDGGALVNVVACTPGATCPLNAAKPSQGSFTAGTDGAVGIQVNSSKNGSVWFSSGWTGTNTAPQNTMAGMVGAD